MVVDDTELGGNSQEIAKRSVKGVLFLTSRSFLIQFISFASTFLLTVFLEPSIFGIFFLVSAFINFFNYFSDIGLAAALIQKKEPLEENDLKTTFLIQETLVGLLLVILFFLSFGVKKWYGLDQPALFLYYSLGFSFFLSSLKTIPSVILERKLKFNLLIVPQILETLVFNLVSVFLAWRGFGITSFTWAVLARGVVGLVAMYAVSPWKIGFSYSSAVLKKLLRFGLPYQINTVIAVLKDDLMTIVLGKIIGTTGLGYLGWAKKWAEQPLRFFMDNVSKVAFPAFSRLQDDKEKLKKSVEKTLFFLCFLTFPVLVGFSTLAPQMVKIIPRYLKWQPAVLALYFYCFNSAWATVSTSMTNLLNAIGHVKKTFKLMIMWLGLTWLIIPILAVKFGYNGVAFGVGIISLSSVVAVIMAKKLVNFALLDSVGKPLFASFALALFLYFLRFWEGGYLIISFKVLSGAIIYLFFSYLLKGRILLKDISLIWHEIKQKN